MVKAVHAVTREATEWESHLVISHAHKPIYARSLYVCIMCEEAYVSNSRAAFHEWGWLMRRLKVYYTDWRLLLLSFFLHHSLRHSRHARKKRPCVRLVFRLNLNVARDLKRARCCWFFPPQMVFYAECKNVCSRVRDNCAAVRLLIYIHTGRTVQTFRAI